MSRRSADEVPTFFACIFVAILVPILVDEDRDKGWVAGHARLTGIDADCWHPSGMQLIDLTSTGGIASPNTKVRLRRTRCWASSTTGYRLTSLRLVSTAPRSWRDVRYNEGAAPGRIRDRIVEA